jgi:hypothetical protein
VGRNVTPMTDCAVRDTRHWSCVLAYYEGRPSISLDMVDGVLLRHVRRWAGLP